MENAMRFHGATADDWIRTIALGIEDDRESLWGVLVVAEGLGLKGSEKMDFTRHCLRSLLDSGTVPAEPTMWAWPPFRPTDRFGTQHDEIVENVIADWLSRGGGDLDWGEYPFTFPENFEIEAAAEWRRLNMGASTGSSPSFHRRESSLTRFHGREGLP